MVTGLRTKSKPYRLKTTKRCPECGTIVKRIRGKNSYYCKNHGFVIPYTYNPVQRRKTNKREDRVGRKW